MITVRLELINQDGAAGSIPAQIAMCNDLNEYDPFHPRFEMDFDGSEQLVDEPMEEYNWEEWLDFGEGPYIV